MRKKPKQAQGIPSIHCKKHGPTHDPYHPNSAQSHCLQDKIYPVDAASLHRLPLRQYPVSMTRTEHLINKLQKVGTKQPVTMEIEIQKACIR